MIRTTHTHIVQWESHRWRLQQCESFTSGLCGSLGGLTADRKINDRETEEVEEEERGSSFTLQGGGGKMKDGGSGDDDG